MPTTPKHDSPANRLIPPPIPKLINIGLENKIHAAANKDRDKSLAANKEAAYFGYDNGRYTNTHWNIRKLAVTKITTPMRLTIQCTPCRAVHPNIK